MSTSEYHSGAPQPHSEPGSLAGRTSSECSGDLGFGSPLGRTVCLLLDGGDALTIDATMRSWAFTGGHRQVQEMVVRLQASLDEAHRQRADGTA
jgi:hypothetical protein